MLRVGKLFNLKVHFVLLRMNYGSCLDRLVTADRVGVKRTLDGQLRVSINGEDCGTAATSIPANTRAVLDLGGNTTQVRELYCQVLTVNC